MLENKNTYIYSIEGKDLYKKTFEIKKNKKFKATLDYSLEVIQIEKVAKKVYKKKKDIENIFYQENEKQYTNKVINLTFKYNVKEYNLITFKNKKYYVHLNSEIDNKNIKDVEFENGIFKKENTIFAIELEAETTLTNKDLPQGFGVKNNKIYLTSTGIKNIANTNEIRSDLYKNGFKIKYENNEIIEYVRFKRSSGSSRVGKCLFIDKRLYKEMLNWSMMGLEFKKGEKIDLAGFEAYIALTTSSIIDTISIEPKNILIIEDFESTFEDTVMATEIKKELYIDEYGIEKERDRLHTESKKIKITNSIWDGQSLLDESLFEEKYKNKGMLLLRNRFFKSCCFNCKIQKFFSDNNIKDIKQLKGFTLAKKIEDIKLITTPSSIKYLKFGTKEKYLELLDSTFGIVKYDKPTHYFNGKMVQTHYQLLNTLQLDENAVENLLHDSLEYVKLLKTDIKVFREHLKIKINEKIEYGDINSTSEFMFIMLQLNNKFENTDLFTNFRQDTIKSYVKNMKKGHILINGNYSVLCGNGLEMLMSSCNMFNGNSILDKDEVFCSNFQYNKQLIGSRSPHVTMGNIWLSTNTNKEKANKIKQYFNMSKQIIFINSIGTNVLERLSSADFDSDTVLLSDNELLIETAKSNYFNFLVPTSMVESKKVKRLNTPEEKCDLDIKTSKNLIGEIINCSQILNSKLWDLINTKQSELNTKEINELYAIISQLDVMSCIEIDKAKKEFSIDNQLELNEIREKYINNNKKPIFFSFLSKEKGNKINENNYKKYQTTMDYLINTIDKKTRKIRQKRRQGENKIVTFGDLLSQNNDKTLKGVKSEKSKKIIEESNNVRLLISNVWSNEILTPSEKYQQSLNLKNDFINFVKKINLNQQDIKKIIYLLNKESKKNKKGEEVNSELNVRARNLLSTLYHSYKQDFIEIFESTREHFDIIEKANKDNDSNNCLFLYGIKYVIVDKNI